MCDFADMNMGIPHRASTPSSCMVLFPYAYGIVPICIWCYSHMHMVLFPYANGIVPICIWYCSNNMYMVFSPYVYGIIPICIRYCSHVYMVLFRYVYGIFPICIWYYSHMHTVLLPYVYGIIPICIYARWGGSRLPHIPMGMRGGGLGSRPKNMYGERLGDGVEYHLMKPTPRR